MWVNLVTINYKEIGKRIRICRKERNFRQNELAELTELSNNYLSNIENGHSIPSIEALLRICEALSVTPDFLLLGSAKKDDIPAEIFDNLRLCNSESLEIISDIVDTFVKRDNQVK